MSTSHCDETERRQKEVCEARPSRQVADALVCPRPRKAEDVCPGSMVTRASACSRAIAWYSASRRESQSCSRASFHAVPRETLSPSSRIFSSVSLSWICRAAISKRWPWRTSHRTSCKASVRIEFGELMLGIEAHVVVDHVQQGRSIDHIARLSLSVEVALAAQIRR